ncbi:MAG: hypothetical protein COT39_00230 [Parcubacteria group bacterium CG08_land_8_20_14_0_20_48_21]|nr:MAG: hypothetical protein AUK21_04200 [Parcubacteria group bacterium CG2_30_48_51]PIS33241.1 MAG: hypothetical protein COT39_00230 [Parcubacteria group bacterium CG08_land_8_20_14_0_20_48_21]PIW79062.1 MAG: hypothetical protein COZ99_03120 [Parcubacteria group bacterium CG_4_8_14_3_um_filter_48_16]PIY78122.1 MAG: hypothetical protein COY83_01515 [Parcubacteria group bacterium CG_4_10_14_0_8_um_filter_48_154]PIZ77049.1 MAG: hypothetical protein COY03_04095 [bacterium CG_4_10_14_0_2_um_filter_
MRKWHWHYLEPVRVRRAILVAMIGFLAGVGLATGLGKGLFTGGSATSIFAAWHTGALIGCVTSCVLLISKRTRLVGCITLFVGLGIIRALMVVPATGKGVSGYADNAVRTYTGSVIEYPESRMRKQHVVIALAGVAESAATYPVAGRVLVMAPLYPPFDYGDMLSFSCALSKPEPFNDFAYDLYLLRKDIRAVCFWPKEVLVWQDASLPGTAMRARATVYGIKTSFLDRIDRLYPDPAAGLLAGLLAGVRSGFSDELTRSLQRTGTSHIVAISGYNITLVARMVFGFLVAIGLWRRRAFYGVLAALVFFVVFTGAESSVTRAAIMGSLVLLAQYLGRPTALTLPLVATAALLVAASPLALLYDPGFQLSFLAATGLIYGEPLVVERWPKLRAYRMVENYVVPTSIAMVATAPLIAASFHTFSLVGLLANVLVLPVVPLAMLGGLITVMVSVLSPALALVLAYPVYGLLSYILGTASYLAQLPFASLALPYFSKWLALALYGGSIMLYVRWRHLRQKNVV